MLEIAKRIKHLTTQYPYNILIIGLYLLSLHQIFVWLNNTQLHPFAFVMTYSNSWAVNMVFNQTDEILNLLGLKFYHENYTFYTKALDGNIGWMEVKSECTPLLGWFYWFFIMILLPGLWKHKLWFIPLGIILIHIMNLMRIASLGIVLTCTPTKFHFFHDILGTLLYILIFFMWILWVEIFSKTIKKSTAH